MVDHQEHHWEEVAKDTDAQVYKHSLKSVVLFRLHDVPKTARQISNLKDAQDDPQCTDLFIVEGSFAFRERLGISLLPKSGDEPNDAGKQKYRHREEGPALYLSIIDHKLDLFVTIQSRLLR